MVYDSRDRLVYSRDGNLKTQRKWLVNLYDGQNRQTMTGLYSTDSSRANLQNSVNAIKWANPVPTIASSALIPLIYTYYDNYNYTGKLNFDTQDIGKLVASASQYPVALPTTPGNMTAGLVTGKRMRIIDTEQWLTTSIYYDDKSRVIQQIADNENGGKDMLTTQYDFNGNVLNMYMRHNNPRSTTTPVLTLLTKMQYDHAGRLLSTIVRLNDNASYERTIAANTYNELGQINVKRIHL